ncbi:MAG: RES domain-containing protein, partial [Actinobacteria bacterium]|nr:RES domain-containing protein [Actinomycetota bacterium]
MTLGTGARTCAKTGLRLLAVEGDRMFRVAPTRYDPISAPERADGVSRDKWGRFDSPGFTLYAAQTRETAYAEVLAQFKRQLGAEDPLAADALAIGMSRDEFLEAIADEWAASSCMGVGAVPASWRHDRGRYG